jgi:hypothetical protein
LNVGATPSGTRKPLSYTGQTGGDGSATLCRRSIDCKPDQHRNSMDLRMPRVTCRSWTADQIALVDRGVSPARASVVLKRPRLAVQNKARELGKPFADFRKVRAMRLTKEAQARKIIEHAAQSSSGPDGASQHTHLNQKLAREQSSKHCGYRC